MPEKLIAPVSVARAVTQEQFFAHVTSLASDLLRGHTDTLRWLAWRLLTLGCDFEVHEPAELVTYLREIGGRAVRAAGPTPRRRRP